MNANVIEIKGRDIVAAYHPEGGEPRLGEAVLIEERGRATSEGVVAQIIGFDSASYPGDREVSLQELLETTIAERHAVVEREPALTDLKHLKILRMKVRFRVIDGAWVPWDGRIPSRNVRVTTIPPADLLAHVQPLVPSYPFSMGNYRGTAATFDASALDKVNLLVGNKGTGKSHGAKLMVHAVSGMGAGAWVFDLNREFINLPGAAPIRVGDNYRLSLAEVGFSFLMALIDDINPFTEVSQGALEHNGPRFMRQEMQRNNDFATIGYLVERAERGAFHTNDMVNGAIHTRLRMIERTGLFENDPAAPSLAQRFDEAAAAGGFLVFDLAEQSPSRLRALTRGFLRRLEAVCDDERRSGRGRYPFVFFEEAHMYAAKDEILNLITRGRHLGLTTFFMTNAPSELPEVIFRQLDNLIITGLSHSTDLRLVARSALSDEDTLQSLAVGLAAEEALVIGRLTNNFPLVIEVNALPQGYPATGVTRTFWQPPGAPAAGPGAAPARARRGRAARSAGPAAAPATP